MTKLKCNYWWKLRSLPLWECGLKYFRCPSVKHLSRHSPCGSVDWNSYRETFILNMCVTPLVGVWIEINTSCHISFCWAVTPLVGVWIEIKYPVLWYRILQVTPLVGVWIEIIIGVYPPFPFLSLPLWECGLKYNTVYYHIRLYCHSPCGSVDWNIKDVRDKLESCVTPLVGVWIEI